VASFFETSSIVCYIVHNNIMLCWRKHGGTIPISCKQMCVFEGASVFVEMTALLK